MDVDRPNLLVTLAAAGLAEVGLVRCGRRAGATMIETADVVVVGGGVVGASTAFHLAQGGAARVVVCERRWVAAGATGKSGALVRTHYTNAPEARLAQASLPYFHNWSDLVGRGDCGFLKCGMARLVASESIPKLEANVDMLERVGVNTQLIGPRELRELAPLWRVDDVVAAAWEPDSGCADPVATAHGFFEAARTLGTDVRLRTEVRSIDVAHGRVAGVQTTHGSIETHTVVVAGGVWSLPLLRDLGIDVRLMPVRVQVALFRRPPQLGGPHPVCIDGINDLWLRPEGPGWSSTLVGAASRRSPLDDADALDEGVDAEYVARARDELAKRMPDLADSPMRGGWAGAITLTEDGKPIIDRHPTIDGLFVFTGDSGSSFKTAPAIGRIFAEWIIDGYPSVLDPRPFRMQRFAEGEPLIGEHEYGDRDTEYSRATRVMLG
ncbi:MAG TPA: FAD-binding oxidoreductase [Ktedonobacterales bacterium]|nr:FAD-binding oxidoreductase [Ktedonobacterales bacterium]